MEYVVFPETNEKVLYNRLLYEIGKNEILAKPGRIYPRPSKPKKVKRKLTKEQKKKANDKRRQRNIELKNQLAKETL